MSTESIIPKNEFDVKPVEEALKLLKLQHDIVLAMVKGATEQYDEYEEKKREAFRAKLRPLILKSCQHERATWNPALSYYICDKCIQPITTNYWLGNKQTIHAGVFAEGDTSCTTEEDIATRRLVDAYFKEFPSRPFETDLCDHSGCC